MNKKALFVLWGVLFLLTAGLGYLPEAKGILRGVMTALSLLFFLPPALLLLQKDRETMLLVRNLSALSLGLTMATLILNFVLAVSSEKLGTVLHYVLVVISAPMICSRYSYRLYTASCLLGCSREAWTAWKDYGSGCRSPCRSFCRCHTGN